MLLFGLWPAEFAKGCRLQKFCVDRLLPPSMTFQVNTKNSTTTFLPQIISVYYLWHCSGRYFYISVQQAKIKFTKTPQAFPLHTQATICTKYTEYRVWKGFALFSSHFWMCFKSVQGKAQGVQQLSHV